MLIYLFNDEPWMNEVTGDRANTVMIDHRQ